MDLFPEIGLERPEPVEPRRLLRLGTSSFSNKDWVGPFYPQGAKPSEFLKLYAARFDAVEIDSTYYGVPRAETVAGWARKTPEWFTIAAKFPREIVHGGDGPRPNPDSVLDPDTTYAVRDEFLSVMQGLGPRLGPLVLQFPRFGPDTLTREVFTERVQRFLLDLPREFSYTLEIRNASWLTAEFAQLLRDHEVALVLSDMVRMPMGDEVEARFDPVTAPFSYVRLLGDHREMDRITTTWDREVIDQTPHLLRWADVLGRLLARDVPTFVFVNNHYAGHAPGTLGRLQKLVREALGDGPDPAI